VDLDAGIDLSVFEDFMTEEETYRNSTKLSIEAVSFTQQRPLQVEEAAFTSLSSGPVTNTSSPFGAPSSQFINQSSASSSFQNRPSIGSSASSPSRAKQGDPFYLDSGPSTEVEDGTKADNRFGTIQLLDSDEEKDSKKKHRKKKKEKKSHAGSVKTNEALGLLSFESGALPPSPRGGIRHASAIIYESDDEDDDVFRPKRTSKEFEGLAKVDLTTPLREDEVMPELKHRVVPHRPKEELRAVKTKKKSKDSKKSPKMDEAPSKDAVGDLLDLGAFAPANPPVTVAAPTAILSPSPILSPTSQPAPMQSSMNPINAAFDDLLGLSAPAPQLGGMGVPLMTTPSSGMELHAETKKTGKRPWMKANIKLSTASGSSSADWSRVTLLYRVYRSVAKDSVAASVVFRFENNSSSEINGLSLVIKSIGTHLIGNVRPGSSIETTKLGPIAFPADDSPLPLKGNLLCSDYQVPVKFSLPASVHLEPVSGLTLEQVAQELSMGGWSSHSCKIDVVSGLQPSSIKQMLCGFFHAEEVDDGSGNDQLVATLAAKSSVSGSSIRIMVKIKERSVKLDLRCTNPDLGKALASDVKHVIL